MEQKELTAQQKWNKKNLGKIQVAYKKDFVQEFKEACKKIKKTQSEVFREAMRKTIDEAKGS